jgi:hypothetical protein
MANELNKKIEKLLLPNEKMLKIYDRLHKENFKFPYFFEIIKNGQILYFLGVNHTTDPKSDQVSETKDYWQKFLSETKKVNCVSLLEGGLRPIVKDEAEAVYKYGEPGLVVHLANKDGIRFESPDTDEGWEIKKLNEAFPRDEVIYYYFARSLDSYFRFQTDKNQKRLEKNLDYFFEKYKKVTGWTDFDFSLDNFVKIHDGLHDHKFSFKNSKCFEDDSHPGKNKIAAESSKIRNIYLASEIINAWRGGKNLFIVFGSGHAIVLEQALKELLS